MQLCLLVIFSKCACLYCKKCEYPLLNWRISSSSISWWNCSLLTIVSSSKSKEIFARIPYRILCIFFTRVHQNNSACDNLHLVLTTRLKVDGITTSKHSYFLQKTICRKQEMFAALTNALDQTAWSLQLPSPHLVVLSRQFVIFIS